MKVLTEERRRLLMNADAVRNRYLNAQVSMSKKYFTLHPKAKSNADRYIFEPTINYDGYVDGVDIYIIVDGTRHYVGDESYIDRDKPEMKVSHTKAVAKVLTSDHHIEMKAALKTKVEPNDSVKLRSGWPLIWASDGDVPAFSHLREPKHEWGIHHYPTFQSAVNLGYPLHNFKVYVSDNDYFYSKFTPIELYDWKNKSILYENNRGTDALPSGVETDIRTVNMDYVNDPYFTQVCSAYIATFLCGISLKNLQWNDHTPKQITSIATYHLYYTMRKFIKNPELMKAYDVSGMKGHFPVSVQSFNGASRGGGTYVKAGWVNFSNSDHLHFIPYDSNGITSDGTKLLMESVESYVYSVLGAQAKTRWSIVSSQLGKSLQTQQAFRRIVNDTVVQTNVNTTISDMRTAIRDTNVILNMAINPNILLIPSRLIILETPIPGYNNILSSPTKTTTFGINTKLNYVGVKQPDPPKKHSPDSTPVHHLDTLKGDTVVPKKVPTTLPVSDASGTQRKVVEFRESSGNGALAGLGIGAIAAFLLLRTVV
jgi:hypothetical protein